MIIRTRAHARAGLIGNPSDGYFGKTISIIIRNYEAQVTLYETPVLRIVAAKQDLLEYESMDDLAGNIGKYGYYGGVRLLKASIKRFRDYCVEKSFELDSRNFSLEYETNVPQRVGLAGSSAIITATLRALMSFYNITIPPAQLANLALSVENDELGLPAGLQDRVIQAYEGCVFMDFNREHMKQYGYGIYEPLDCKLLPPLYVASLDSLAEGTEVFHSNIRARWEAGEEKVVRAMEQCGEYAQIVRDLLVAQRGNEIGPWLDKNFDLRASIYKISDQNLEMIDRARKAGASAQFAGSGGAIVGTYPDAATFARVKKTLKEFGATVIKPIVS